MINDLETLLANLEPDLDAEDYFFYTTTEGLHRYLSHQPFALVNESEGITLIMSRSAALHAGFSLTSPFRKITLSVQSSLSAVGLTAAVSGRLAAAGIAANVIAGYYHDHIFVPATHAETAVTLLRSWQL